MGHGFPGKVMKIKTTTRTLLNSVNFQGDFLAQFDLPTQNKINK